MTWELKGESRTQQVEARSVPSRVDGKLGSWMTRFERPSHKSGGEGAGGQQGMNWIVTGEPSEAGLVFEPGL